MLHPNQHPRNTIQRARKSGKESHELVIAVTDGACDAMAISLARVAQIQQSVNSPEKLENGVSLSEDVRLSPIAPVQVTSTSQAVNRRIRLHSLEVLRLATFTDLQA